MSEDIVNCLFGTSPVKKILVVDKAPDFDPDSVQALAALIAHRGVAVSVKHCDEFKDLHSQSSSILAIIRKTKEVVIVFSDAPTRTNALPKDIHCAANKIIILYVHTTLKKLPYAKKQFDRMFVINDECNDNQYIKMTRGLIADDPMAIDDMLIHDLNMVSLVLLQNVFKLGMPPHRLQGLYDIMVNSELFAHDDLPMTTHLQALGLLVAFKHADARPIVKLDFTQHLSKYSVQSATKKKLTAKLDFLRSCDRPYEQLMFGRDCPAELQDIRKLFFASLGAYNSGYGPLNTRPGVVV